MIIGICNTTLDAEDIITGFYIQIFVIIFIFVQALQQCIPPPSSNTSSSQVQSNRKNETFLLELDILINICWSFLTCQGIGNTGLNLVTRIWIFNPDPAKIRSRKDPYQKLLSHYIRTLLVIVLCQFFLY